jgi:hypothetical protein
MKFHEDRFLSPMAALVCVLSTLLFGVSCASTLTGVTEKISVDSNPQGADVALFCKDHRVAAAVTPASFTIARNAGDCVAHVSKTGYADQNATIEQGVNPAYWSNFLTSPGVLVGAFLTGWGGAAIGAPMILAGGSGWLVDLRTGAIHAHRPSRVRVTLQAR